MTEYILTRHSAWMRNADPQFEYAVEASSLSNTRQARYVEKVGGVVYADYTAASIAEDDENYPPGVTGIIPRVRGTFVNVPLYGFEVYVPQSELAKLVDDAIAAWDNHPEPGEHGFDSSDEQAESERLEGVAEFAHKVKALL